MTTTVITADDYADAVDMTLARYGVKGRAVGFQVWRKGPRVVVEIDTQPCDVDMESLRDKMMWSLRISIEAAELQAGSKRHAFIFHPLVGVVPR